MIWPGVLNKDVSIRSVAMFLARDKDNKCQLNHSWHFNFILVIGREVYEKLLKLILNAANRYSGRSIIHTDIEFIVIVI